MITIQKVTSNVQSVPRQSPDIYWHTELCSRRPCSVYHGPHTECILWWPYSTNQHCGDCWNTLSFSWHPREKKIGRTKSGDLGRPNGFRNDFVRKQRPKSAIDIRGLTIKFANLIVEGLFIMNLYQLDKQSTTFTIWKYWKGCVEKLDGNDPNFLPTTHGSCITTMHLLTRHCLWGRF